MDALAWRRIHTFAAQQSYSLIKFIKNVCSKAREAPVTSQRELLQVEQLVKLAGLVKQNPSLLSKDLVPVLDVCLARAAELLAVLEELHIKEMSGKCERIKIAFKAVMKDKKVAGRFTALKQQKNLLALYVQNIDS